MSNIQNSSTHGETAIGGFFSLFGLKPTVFKRSFLVGLGEAMTKPNEGFVNSYIPAGYTYLGQFIAHDISRLAHGGDPPIGHPLDIKTLLQIRTPALDLDCVYGDGFSDPAVAVDSSNGEMLLGEGVNRNKVAIPGIDLPRNANDGKAMIGDDRNDENLLVAQLHLQFLKLHNFFAARIREYKPSSSPEEIYDQARIQLQLHYQHVVLYDFLFRILDRKVWKHVILGNRGTIWDPVRTEAGRMPIELSAAALRFGHSMVQHRYTLSKENAANLDVLFSWTGGKKLDGSQRLPEELSVDLLNFFFADYQKQHYKSPLNLARSFLPFLKMKRNDPGEQRFVLATHNLLRGNEFGLPDAQSLIRYLANTYPDLVEKIKLKALNPKQHGASAKNVLSNLTYSKELGEKTPLWFYVLQEAYAQHDGKRLGKLGSLIVAESFRALTYLSEPSILHGGHWISGDIDPTLKYKGKNYLQMTDLLRKL